jgi:hypothetical protein
MTQAAAGTAQTTPTTASDVLDASKSAPPTPQTGEASKTSPTDDKISPKLQVLIQREKAAVERERAAKALEASAVARGQEIEARLQRLNEFENIKKTNPRKALELLGMSYQDLTQVELNDGEIPPEIKIKQVEEKFSSFVESQKAERQAQEEAQKQAEAKHHESTIAKFKGEIGTHLKENSNRYELIEFEQSQDLVYDVIDEHYNRTYLDAVKKAEETGDDVADVRGEVLSISQAADKVEAHLEKKYDKARNLNKVKTLLAPRQAIPSVEKPKAPQRQQPTTLNNNLSASPASPRKFPLTDEERVAKAISYAKSLRP